MTLRQDELIKNLAKNNFNVSKTAREVGYTEQSSRAGTLYEALRRRMAKAYNPEQVKADIRRYERKFEKEQDNSNLSRMVELRSKIAGLTKENNIQVNTALIDTLQQLKAEKPIETQPASS